MGRADHVKPVDRTDPVELVRRCCLALPETTERLSHGSPSWFVRERRTFVSLADHTHGDAHLAIWAAAPPGVAGELVAAEPARFFVPPYVGHRGWIGVRLDLAGADAVDPDELAEIVTDAYRQVAPTTLVRRLLDADPSSPGGAEIGGSRP